MLKLFKKNNKTEKAPFYKNVWFIDIIYSLDPVFDTEEEAKKYCDEYYNSDYSLIEYGPSIR